VFSLWRSIHSQFSKRTDVIEYSELLDVIYDFKL
jgi:hypothetical protein